jgi:hypothetical protein
MSFQGSDLKPLKAHFDKSIDTEQGGVIIRKSIFDSIEFKTLSQTYVKESVDLYKGILLDHGIIENDVDRVDFFLQSENIQIENLGKDFKKALSEAEMKTNNFFCQDKFNYLEELTKLVGCFYAFSLV